MEQLRVQARSGRGRDGVEEGTGMCGKGRKHVQVYAGVHRCGWTGAKSQRVMHEGMSMGRVCAGMHRHGRGHVAVDKGAGLHESGCWNVWVCAGWHSHGQRHGEAHEI